MSKPWLLSLFQALRPKQWTKNAVVFAAFFFALGDRNQQVGLAAFWIAVQATLLFCVVSSGIYLMNDVRDAPWDRAHPTKKFRPIAAGEVSPAAALVAAALLLAAGMTGAWFLSHNFAAVLLSYIGLQIVYTLVLKQVVLLDLFVIAAGFVLRAMAGAVAVNVTISPWLLLCAMLLALFLALCKRRHEKVVVGDTAGETRANLGRYDERLLDQLIAVVSAATLVFYALYTLWPDTVQKFGNARLAFTIPFVIFGLFRYLDLVYRHDKGGHPEQILLTDAPLLVDLLLYGATVFVLLFVAHP
ncbi:MAG TPA: decaprenyl-phosphate phosphoribosyltransferase [Kiritimatiellia bacterium]|nr:decaprenyl-phosphate phosphoribosyltransferase [Kiritimatiellia bacterium]